MTPKERWLAVLNGEQPDRLPMDFWGTPEVWDRLKRHFGCSENLQVMEQMRIDYLVPVAPRYVGPSLEPGQDIYGNRHRVIDYGSGTVSVTSFFGAAVDIVNPCPSSPRAWMARETSS